MKRFSGNILALSLLIMLLAFTSCKLISKSTKGTDASSANGVVTGGGDGSSCENAVIIQTTNQTDGVAAEYDWLKENYPGYSLIKTDLEYSNNVPYDVFEIKTADGTKKKIYFDISEFFGK